ncbi:MAG: hypothetical protein LBM60_03110 [Clostridium sp.]|jgi:uncharacterized membrane protein YfcA|nr:hypothetical protein [Clostridium sp.]
MKRKTLPLLLMLIAGAITCVVTYLRKDILPVKLIVLFGVMLIFYFFGCAWKWTLEYFDRQNRPPEEEPSVDEAIKTDETDDLGGADGQ